MSSTSTSTGAAGGRDGDAQRQDRVEKQEFFKRLLTADAFPFGDQCEAHEAGGSVVTMDLERNDYSVTVFETDVAVSLIGAPLRTRLAIDFDDRFLLVCVTPYVVPSPSPVVFVADPSTPGMTVPVPQPDDVAFADKIRGQVVAQLYLCQRSARLVPRAFPFDIVGKLTVTGDNNVGSVFSNKVEVAYFSKLGAVFVYNASRGLLAKYSVLDPSGRVLAAPVHLWHMDIRQDPKYSNPLPISRNLVRLPQNAKFVFHAVKIVKDTQADRLLLVTGCSPIHVLSLDANNPAEQVSYEFENPPWEVMKQLGYAYKDTPVPPTLYLINLFNDTLTGLPMANFALEPSWSHFYTRLVTQLDPRLNFEWFWGGLGRDAVPDTRDGRPPVVENVNTGWLCRDAGGTWATFESEPMLEGVSVHPNLRNHNCLIYRTVAEPGSRRTVYLNAAAVQTPSVSGVARLRDGPSFKYGDTGGSLGPYKVPDLPMLAYICHSPWRDGQRDHGQAMLYFINIARVQAAVAPRR